MRLRAYYIITLVFFLWVNTWDLWRSNSGLGDYIESTLFIIYILLLGGIFIYQLGRFAYEKFRNRNRFMLVLTIAVVFLVDNKYPHGIYDFKGLHSPVLLFAEGPKVNQCYVVFKLLQNKNFIEEDRCLGCATTTGNYMLKGDTIFFTNVIPSPDKHGVYKFGVIIPDTTAAKSWPTGQLDVYESYNDSTPNRLTIFQNALKARAEIK